MEETSETVARIAEIAGGRYKYGFVTDIESEFAPKGLNEDIVGFISSRKDEPGWLLEWRLRAYRHWSGMEEPGWAFVDYPPIDYQDAYYYAAPKSPDDAPKSLDEVDPKLLETYEKLGIPLNEQMRFWPASRAPRRRPSTRSLTASRSQPPSRRSSPKTPA